MISLNLMDIEIPRGLVIISAVSGGLSIHIYIYIYKRFYSDRCVFLFHIMYIELHLYVILLIIIDITYVPYIKMFDLRQL